MKKNTSILSYLELIPTDQKKSFIHLRQTILNNLPDGFEEISQYGMIGYVVPLSFYPVGYHCDPTQPLPFMQLGSQKTSITLYHMGIYSSPDLLDRFTSERTKRVPYALDMGKSCIRNKKYDKIPYALYGELFAKMSVEEWVLLYESMRGISIK